jgi:hypothetical protein
MKTQELFIDGAWTSTPDHLEVTNPCGSVISQAAKCERALITERAEEFAQSIRAEAGKPITAARAEVGRAIDTVQFSAEAARGLTGATVPLDAVKSGVGLLALLRRAAVEGLPPGRIAGCLARDWPQRHHFLDSRPRYRERWPFVHSV